MPRSPGALAVLLCLVASCTKTQLPDPVTRYGLEAGTRHRTLAKRAIATANAILPPNSPVRLRLATEGGSGVPVYLVRGDTLGASEYCFVPPAERCVFVNDDRMDNALALVEGNPAGALALTPSDVLALMLLHEAGHIAAGDSGSYTPPVKLSIDALTSALNASKSRELSADAFAVDAVRGAVTPGQPMARFTAGAALELTLVNASWNLSTSRLLDHFAATALRERRIFLDQGYSHPNFELRFLIMNYRLRPTETGRTLLNDFLVGRKERAPGLFEHPSLLGVPSLSASPDLPVGDKR